MGDKTLFEKIIDREIPADIVLEDELCIAFRDINPQAPMHILVCPKKVISMLSRSETPDAWLLGHLLLKSSEIAAKEGYEDSYRVVINNGAEVGQTVFHLHLHILGGRKFGWPPG